MRIWLKSGCLGLQFRPQQKLALSPNSSEWDVYWQPCSAIREKIFQLIAGSCLQLKAARHIPDPTWVRLGPSAFRMLLLHNRNPYYNKLTSYLYQLSFFRTDSFLDSNTQDRYLWKFVISPVIGQLVDFQQWFGCFLKHSVAFAYH